MPQFDTFDDLPLHYSDDGDGRTVVLLHGFAADTNLNYVRSGILDALLDEEFRVVTLDLRGHGLSAKPTDVAAYEHDAMKRDVGALFDHLGLDDVLLVGYSMGARLALRFAGDDPRVAKLVLLGLGSRGAGDTTDTTWKADLVAVLEADSLDDVEESSLRQFRMMAGLDRVPLLAYTKATESTPTRDPESVAAPVLMIVGDDDDHAGDPAPLAQRLEAKLVRVPGDHFQANSRPELHQALLGFLSEEN